MKILHISNYYYHRGGDCTYLFALMKLLDRNGHKNIAFSMHHPQNIESQYSDYFVSYMNYADEVKRKTPLSAIKVLYKAIYSKEAKKNIERLIIKEKPDIAHVQSLHHNLTHSILHALKKHNVPVVWTLHDYALICPNTNFLSRGRICEQCKKTRFYMALIERCKKDSLAASTVAMLETVAQRIMRINDLVDIYIAPSNFLRNKLIEYGFSDDKIVCINNFIDLNLDNEPSSSGDYYLYAGRLTREKGVKTLIDAAIKANIGKLKIVGEGTMSDELKAYVKEKNADKIIEFLGHMCHEKVIDLIKRCRFVVLPSEWYENFPYAVIEAFAMGKAVIGAKIGGIPEMIKDNKTGMLFETGNVDDLVSKIVSLSMNSNNAAEMGGNGRSYFEQELNAEKHYQRLMEIYNSAVK